MVPGAEVISDDSSTDSASTGERMMRKIGLIEDEKERSGKHRDREKTARHHNKNKDRRREKKGCVIVIRCEGWGE